MNFKKNVNILRRNIMHAITKNIGRSATIPVDPGQTIGAKRILICRPNHRLGNLLLITPLVQEINTTFPDCTVDLFIKGGLVPIVFKNYDNIGRIIQLPKKPFKEIIQYTKVWITIKKQHYDIVINVDSKSSSGRIATNFARARYKFFGDEYEEELLNYPDSKHIAKRPVYNFRNNLAKVGIPERPVPVPVLDLKLSDREKDFGKKVLDELVNDPNKKTIAIFTFATGAKCYSEAWWAEFYEKLKYNYSGYNIIEILPVENVSQIGFKAPSFYSKDVREMGAVIANTVLFIGADSGIMHLASASLVPVLGLFAVTDPKKYEPYNHKSLAVDTNSNDAEACMAIIHTILNTE